MKKLIQVVLILVVFANTGFSQKATVVKLSDEERLQWWHEARFGMFIHWGIYSLYGGVYNGHEQIHNNGGWIMNRCKIPVAEYKEKAKEFNPVNYDPDYWVRLAKEAGMKYIVITTKHHDGFALFESEASEWNVVDATPYGKDLLKPLAEACQKYDMKLGFYYSQAQDWGNPGGIVARRESNQGYLRPDSADIDKYTLDHNGYWDPVQESEPFYKYIDQVAVPQVREILTNYGEVAVLWWDTPDHMTYEAARDINKLLELQPNIITNDRLMKCGFPGDIKSPEQRIPKQNALPGQNWESCMTMNNCWGYRKNDHNWKSTEVLIRNLIEIASKGGNYLLNIGPKPDGTIPEPSLKRLTEIGEWMKVNGEAIYSTKGSPFGVLPWGRCTHKEDNGNTILYFSVFDWPNDGKLMIPGLKNRVLDSKLLAGDVDLKTVQVEGGIQVNIPLEFPDPIATVVKITVEGIVDDVKMNFHEEDKNEDFQLD